MLCSKTRVNHYFGHIELLAIAILVANPEQKFTVRIKSVRDDFAPMKRGFALIICEFFCNHSIFVEVNRSFYNAISDVLEGRQVFVEGDEVVRALNNCSEITIIKLIAFRVSIWL